MSINPNLIYGYNVTSHTYIDLFLICISSGSMGYELISQVKQKKTNLKIDPWYFLVSGVFHVVWGYLKKELLLLKYPLMNFNGIILVTSNIGARHDIHIIG